MLPRRRGAIVNIASMSGSIVNRGLFQSHSNASKAGVAHLTRSLAVEWADRGLRQRGEPGLRLDADDGDARLTGQRERFAANTPMGHIATTEDIAGPCVFLLSDAAAYCTGVDLAVDGGFTVW